MRDRRRWTTEEHLRWLEEALPDYLAAVASGSLHKFLQSTYEQWFKDFPEAAAKPEDYVESEVESDDEPSSDNDNRVFAHQNKRRKAMGHSPRKRRRKVS